MALKDAFLKKLIFFFFILSFHFFPFLFLFDLWYSAKVSFSKEKRIRWIEIKLKKWHVLMCLVTRIKKRTIIPYYISAVCLLLTYIGYDFIIYVRETNKIFQTSEITKNNMYNEICTFILFQFIWLSPEPHDPIKIVK